MRASTVAVALLLMTSAFLAGSALAGSGTITVCPDGSCDHTSIQDAVDAADPGDTIQVQAGTYDEQVVVTKDLSIEAADGATLTRSQAPGGIEDNSFMVVNQSASLTLDGLTFQGPFPSSNTAGIFVTGQASVAASDLLMDQMFVERNGEVSGAQYHNAIVVGDQRFVDDPGAGSLRLTNSTIDEFGKSAVTVTGPDSSADLDAVTISGSGTLDSGNPAQDTLLLDAGATLDLTDSTIQDVRYEASFIAGTGISLFGDADATIEDNTFTNVAKPVSVQAFRGFDNTPGTVQNLTVTGNEMVGAFAAVELFSDGPDANPDIVHLRDSRIRNNTARRGTVGLAGGFGSGGGEVVDTAIEDNRFENNDVQAAQTDGPFDLDEIARENSFDGAALISDGDGVASTLFSSIGDALDGVSAGDTVTAYEARYDESLSLSTPGLTLRGHGDVVLEDTLSVRADGVSLESLTVQPAPANANGITVPASIADLSLQDLRVEDARIGFRTASTAAVDGLTIEDSVFSSNEIAIYTTNDPNPVDDPDNLGEVQDVTIRNVELLDSERKGIYAETLDDALIEDLTVSGVTSDTYGFNNGIDINLKAGDYGNITIRDSVVEDVSEGDPFFGIDAFSAAIAIKARDDPTRYDTNPGRLDGVSVVNVTVRDSFNGLRVGEPGVDYGTYQAPKNVEIHESSFTGIEQVALSNVGNQTVDATHNWWGAKTGPTADGNPLNGTVETGERVEGDVDVTPWCLVPSCLANGAVHDLSPHPAGLT